MRHRNSPIVRMDPPIAVLKRFCIAAFGLASICFGLVQVAGAQKANDDGRRLKVSVAEGERHLAKKVAPAYPQLAQLAHLEGKVVLSAIVSPAGAVEKVTAISGHPMLLQAAMDAVKQSQYDPFLLNGEPVTALVPIEITFALPNSSSYPAPAARLVDRCRLEVQEHLYAEAVEACTSLVDIFEKLSPENQMWLRYAYRYAGDAFWFQNKFPEAQAYYLKELASSEKITGSYDYLSLDSGSPVHAYYDAAHGYQGMGDFSQARLYYQRADQALETQYAQVDATSQTRGLDREADPVRFRRSAEDDRARKQRISRDRQSLLREYAAMLRKSEDASSADAAAQKAKALALKELASAEKIEPDPHHVALLNDLIDAYYDAARGYRGAGEYTQAGLYYQRADQALQTRYAQVHATFQTGALETSANPALSRSYAEGDRSLKQQLVKAKESLWREYAAMLRESGDASAADAAEQKAKSLAVEIDSEINSKEK